MRRPGLFAWYCLTLTAAAQSPTWDVPHRGAVLFRRSDENLTVHAPPSLLRPLPVIAGAEDGGHEWRFLAAPADGLPAGFEAPGHDDSGWPLGRGEFGPDAGKAPRVRSAWATAALALRCRVDLGAKKPKALLFRCHHDDGLRIFWNGRQVIADDGYGRNREYVLTGDALDAWQKGENLFAVRCSNIGGAQYLDVSLAAFPTLPPGVKDAEGLREALREEREQGDRVRRELFGPFRPPPLLLQGELDATQHRLRLAPADLRDLGAWLATDLDIGLQGGIVSRDADRLFRLGDLQLRGRATAVDANGWQTIEVTVKNTPEPAPGEDSKRFVDRFVRPHVWYGFDGKLLVKRQLEPRGSRARVLEFTVALQGRVLRGKDWKEHAANLQHQERWQLEVLRENQDAAFRAGVQQALERGTAWLRGQVANLQHPDLRAEPDDSPRSYHGGRLALALLALVKGGVAKDDEVVQKGYAELRRRRLIDTYSLGNALMAIEALYVPASEFSDLKQGTIDQPQKRKVPPEDLAVMQRWVDQLLKNHDDRVDPAFLLRFHYVGGGDYDHSVNQYALLGLYSAHLCGIDIPATTWEAAANHLLAAQSPGGAKLSVDLVDYRTHARRTNSPDEKFTVSRLIGRAAGWNYKDPKSDGELSPTWGSMTCAGITGLAICQAALAEAPGQKRVRLMADAARARNDGFAWLAQHLTVRCHAGDIERQQLWYYYYLYGLERAALLSGIALIQDRDWYFEGAQSLIMNQLADGSWPVELVRYNDDRLIDDTAMAILFLKRGTLPVLTGR